MFCITYILIWTNLVPTSVSCVFCFVFCFTFLAHSIQSSLTYWQRNSLRWRLAFQLYSGYSIIWLIGLSLFNLVLSFPTSCSPTLALLKGLYCPVFCFVFNTFFHYTLLTAGVLMTHARLTGLLTTQDWQDWSRTTTTLTTDRKLTDLLTGGRKNIF